MDLRFGGSHQELLTGDRREVQDQLITLTDGTAADSDPLFFQTIYAPSAWALGRPLDVDAEWGGTVDGVAGETAADSTISVTGTSTIGGVQCYVLKAVA